MRGSGIAQPSLCWFVFVGILPAQTPAKIDFGQDVLPVLRQNCVPCHGPSQQNSGLRLDRKSSVINRRGVVPGSSENSFLFHRISGTAFGMQMPPTGPLRPEQINLIKTMDRPGRRLAGFTRQRSGAAAVESQGRGHGGGITRGRPSGLHEDGGRRPQASQRARTGGFHSLHVCRALQRRGDVGSAVEAGRGPQQTE